MNVLVIYKKNSGNAQSYYDFIRSLIERIALEKEIKTYHYRPDFDSKNISDGSIIWMKFPDKSGVALSFWYRVSLAAIIKKCAIGKIIFINAAPIVKFIIPQISIFTDVDFLSEDAKLNSHQLFLQKNFKRKNNLLNEVITYSQFATEKIAAFISPEKIKIVPAAAAYNFLERSYNEKEIRKENLTNGEEFFLAKIANTDEEQLVKILKAFTVFKQWQKSNMKMVITGFEKGLNNALKRKIQSYKYSEDVVVLNEEHEDIYPEILSAAYSFLLLTKNDADIIPVAEALQSYTLLIAYPLPSLVEIAENSFIKIEKDSYENIGNILISIYKNENIRDEKIASGAEKIVRFELEKSKEILSKFLDF